MTKVTVQILLVTVAGAAAFFVARVTLSHEPTTGTMLPTTSGSPESRLASAGGTVTQKQITSPSPPDAEQTPRIQWQLDPSQVRGPFDLTEQKAPLKSSSPKSSPTAGKQQVGQGTMLSDGAKAAREFTFETTKLGSSLADFRKKYPAAVQSPDSDQKLELNIFAVPSTSAKGCGYRFYQGRLYEFGIVYDAPATSKLGASPR